MAAGQRRIRADQDAARCHRADQAGYASAENRRRGHRMHQLRRVLCGLRYCAVERGISGPGGAHPRLDAGQRRTRRRQYRPPASHRRRRRLSRLPLASIVPGTVPAGAQSDRGNCRAQAPHRGGLSQRRDQGMNVRLYLWQRATAAVMAPLVIVHIAVILYATRHGVSAAEILARTRGSIAWAAFYGLFVFAVSIHASIGLRNTLSEWTPLPERRVDACVVFFGLVLALLGLRAVAAVVLP